MAEPFPSLASPSGNRDLSQHSPSTAHSRNNPTSANRHDHPYSIRTTSSSLLTRSNSIGSVHKPPLHASVTPTSPALGRSQGRGHKHAKSQTSAPPPLPLASPERSESSGLSPSQSPTPGDRNYSIGSGDMRDRVRRSDTMPTIQPKRSESAFRLEDLPSNPKVWTSSHLASYLSSALRVKGGGSLPTPVIRDIAGFVVNQKLNGRVFLRLTQRDLEGMGMNQLWRPALLDASRALRQNVVQGRIWGFGGGAEEQPASPTASSISTSTSTTAKHTSLPSLPSTVYEDYVDEFSDRSPIADDRGKVKNMVANFERSASSSSGISDNSPDDETVSRSPFDFDSPLPSVQELPSPSPNVAALSSNDDPSSLDDPQLEVHSPNPSYDAELASEEVTSGSEAGDEQEDEENIKAGGITTVLEKENLAEHVAGAGSERVDEPQDHHEHDDPESDCSPTSSILPQTPPPMYVADSTPTLADVSSKPETTAAPDEARVPLPSRHSHSRSPSSTIILTSRRNPSFVAEIIKDSGSDNTIENLLANFNAADHPLAASWGANAWLDESPLGSTARKIHEPVSISRRGNRLSQGRGHEPKRSSLSGLFEEVPLPAVAVAVPTAEVAIDATSSPSEEVDPQAWAALAEKQARQGALLEEFRTRLEEVEKRLEEMEERDAERDALAMKQNAVSLPNVPDDQPAAPDDHIEEDAIAIKSPVRSTHVSGDEWEDPSLGGLPSYVFLVGLGVCAIAMRVVIRKVVGRKPSLLGYA